jgi:MFS superfamily sulfate permease-like transporter
MAYALMINVPPQYGVYSALYGSFIYSLIGSSRHVSVGPITTNFLMISKAVQTVLKVEHDDPNNV